MTQILHITDPHVGKTKAEARNLRKIVDYILSNYSDGDERMIVLISGDLVDDGQQKQFSETREILDPLFQNKRFLVWTIPGNHDYGWNGTHAQSKRFKYFKKAFYGPFENVTYPHIKHFNGHVFIGLNTMKAETGFWDGLLADGELGNKQLRDLNGILNQLEGRRNKRRNKVIVHLHHHPFIFPDDEDNVVSKGYEQIAHKLKDSVALMHIIAGRVDVIVFGHDHEHLDFSKTKLGQEYRIPYILSGGKCTEYQVEYKLDKDGKKTPTELNKGLMGRMITIKDSGKVSVKTVVFDA